MRKNITSIEAVKNGRDLYNLLKSEGYDLPEVIIQRILTAARRIHVANEDSCNGLENTLALKHYDEDVAFLNSLVKSNQLPELIINGDPRGYPVKLLLPSGRYNTWGGKEHGFGFPDK